MIKVVLIDDEPKALETLKWEINQFCPDLEVIDTFQDSLKALEYLKNCTNIDCIFLDISMPSFDGFQLLNELPNRNFEVIFTTAYDQYAIDAIKENALDYLLKPVDSDDLKLAVKKIIGRLKLTDKDLFEKKLLKVVEETKSSIKKIGFNTDGKIIFMLPEEIIYCEADGNYTTIYTEGNKKLVLTQTLKKIESKLVSPEFFRVHNSYIINLTKIKEYIKNDSCIVLKNGINVPVARQRKSILLEQF